jgi:hypothetical protein
MSIYDKASLVLIPSGTKTSKVYSQKPVNGDGDFTFSRSTAATRVNADGLIEKETQNLYIRSQEMENAIWSKARGSLTANATTSPDGTTTADLWTEDTSNGTHDIRQSITTTSGGFYTFSIYVKANGRTKLDVFVGGASKSAKFDLTSGSVIGGDAPIKKIEDAGNSWWRVSVGCLATSTTTTAIWILNNGTTQSYTGNGVSGMYFWGAQAEQSLVARDYIETTTTALYGGITDNVPRLDYTDSSCPSLLLEPQRTNLFEHSEYLGTGVWSKIGIGLYYNYAVSPEGLSNATKLYPASTGTFRYAYNQSSGSSSQYTISAYVKAAGKNVAWLYIESVYGQGVVYFDLSDGSKQEVNGSSNTITGTIDAVGNDWYKVSATLGTAVAMVSGSGIGVSDSKGNLTATANGDNGILFYGLQLEAGSYATSYIPTYGTSVTRNADAASKTGISSLIGQTEGTLFAEFTYEGNVSGSFEISPLYVGTGTYATAIYIDIYQGNIYAVMFNGGVNQASINGGSLSVGNHKVAIGYANNDVVLYLDGIKLGSDTSATIPSCDRAYLGVVGTSTQLQKYKQHQSLLFKTRLSNEELAALTTI